MKPTPPETLPLRDPYAVLGIDRRADAAAIKRAYFQLVRDHPPEREPEKFKEIRAAYELIQSPERRARTDLFLLQPPPTMPSRRAPSYDLSVHDEDLLELALRFGLLALTAHDDFRTPRLL